MLYRSVIGICLGVLIVLQISLWGEQGILDWIQLNRINAAQERANEMMKANNKLLLHQVGDLRSDAKAIEELAREELGMIKKKETFVRLIKNSVNQESDKVPLR